MSYPVEILLPDLKKFLATNRVALVSAATGSGKTTVLPLALANEPWLEGKKIVMLEPRRIAAKMAVWRMMDIATYGIEVGFRVRGENTCRKSTQIEVVTEAILTRMIQDDPELSDIGLLIFDEFHERNIHTDLGLALALDVQSALREDLRIVIMSATLDQDALINLIPDARVFSSEGKLYPVDVVYCSKPSPSGLITSIISAILRAFRETNGDILVFLPGIAQIRACESQLASLNLPNTILSVLHSSLTKQAQEQAVRKSDSGRKIIISSSIAESSLTIEGITAVVDSCLERYTQFFMGTGMDQLLTAPASLASLDQRKGRAGRLSSGRCYRLLSPQDERHLSTHTLPEIERCDLANLVLELAQWGCSTQVNTLRFLTPPKPSHYQHAFDLLCELEAINSSGSLTELGKKMLKLPLHPRFSHLLLCAPESKESQFSNVELVAILSENDPLKNQGANIVLRHGNRVYTEAINDLDRSMKNIGVHVKNVDESVALALAFPDRIAKQRERGSSHYLMANGRGVKFFDEDSLQYHPFLVVPVFDDKQENGIIKLATPISIHIIKSILASAIKTVSVCSWDESRQRVTSLKREQLGAIVLSESQQKPSHEQALPILLDVIKKQGISQLPWSDGLLRLRQRINFLHQLDAFSSLYPDLSDNALEADLESWIPSLLEAKIALSQISEHDLRHAIENKVGYEAMRQLAQLAPESLEVPSGSKIKIDYSNSELGPFLAVRLQELFGWFISPKIAQGRVNVTLQMLSPAMRPVQTTQDLANFWKEGYFFVRKDLRGRYPKHYWPEDPLDAEAIKGSKKRKS